MPVTTPTQPPLRYAKAVASAGTLVAAPLMGYMCIVDSGVGIDSPYRWCTGMASSVICSKKSTFQYHCNPLGISTFEWPGYPAW